MRVLATTLVMVGLALSVEPGRGSVHDRTGPQGTWSGELRHEGQLSTLALRLDPAGDSTLAVQLSLPAVDVWNLPIGNAALQGDSLRLGWWSFHYDPSRDVLEGDLPGALVPVYRIPFTLSRTDSISRASATEEDAPVREPLWIYDAGSPLWAGVTAGAGLVYAGSDNGILVALDAVTGEPVWTRQARGPLRARPTLAEGWLLLHSDDGSLYALDPVTGEERWRTALLDSLRTRVAPGTPGSRYEHYASAPAVAGARIYVGAADGTVHCLDLASGDRHWVARTGDAVNMTPAVSGGSVIVGSFDGRVYAFDADTGRELWVHDTGAPIVSSPVVAGSLILIGSRSYDFLALDAGTGDTAWKRYFWFSWVESSAALGGSIAFVGSSDAQLLWALDVTSGRPLWTVDTGGSVWGDPCLSGTTVFVGTVGVADYMIDHRAGFVAVDREEGTIRWRYPLARPTGAKLWGFASSPAVDAERVYVGGLDGRVRAFPQ